MAESNYINALLAGDKIASSRIPKAMLETLLSEGLITVTVHGSRKSVRALDAGRLKQFLIDNDEKFRILDIEGKTSRAEQAYSTGNSKLISVRSCPGFPVNSYEPIECELNGDAFVVHPANGSFTFIYDWQSFSVPEDVIIVGIENMENFRLVQRQQYLFEECLGGNKLLFVSRYPQSADLRSWLKIISNRYVHFGDFDLAGIKIFQTEFEKYLGERASFLIPSDIKTRLHIGSSKRYDDQINNAAGIFSDNPALQGLIDLIHRERKGYDQEGYIKSPTCQECNQPL